MNDNKEPKESSERNVEMVRKYSKQASEWVLARYLRFLIWILVIPAAVLIVMLAFWFGKAVGSYQFSAAVEQATGNVQSKEFNNIEIGEVDFGPFWDAWVLLEQNFVDGANGTSTDEISEDQDRVWGAIQGLAASYGDPFTNFLPPEESENFAADISGEFIGVGMEIGNRDSLLTVISPLPGTPADRAGVRPKDIISQIDGKDTLRMSADQAVQLIRGEQGDPVELTILRPGDSEARTITIVRDLIEIPTIETQQIGDVFVIKLFSFTSKSPVLFRDALESFSNSGAESLLIDLRGNPGGFLEAAIDITSRFLPDNKIIVTEKYAQQEKVRYSRGYDQFGDQLKMVILINGGSASASEIMAGALRDHDQALLVGQQTFGKGSVQELFTLTRETALKITVAKWLTPQGEHISEDGIAPDITLEPYLRTNTEEGGTYHRDFSQDREVQQAVKILMRDDFYQLLQEVPDELQNVASTTAL